MIEVRIDSGIETAMMSVLRQLPRKSRIISAVRPAAISASRITPLTAASHEDRLVGQRLRSCSSGGRGLRDARQQCRGCPLTTSSVEALPVLMMVTSTPRWPSWRTILVCGAKPSLTVRDVAQIDGRRCRPS